MAELHVLSGYAATSAVFLFIQPQQELVAMQMPLRKVMSVSQMHIPSLHDHTSSARPHAEIRELAGHCALHFLYQISLL